MLLVVFRWLKVLTIREIAISHFENGRKAPEIARLLANKVHRTTIHRWISRFKQSSSIGVRTTSGRPYIFLEKVKRLMVKFTMKCYCPSTRRKVTNYLDIRAGVFSKMVRARTLITELNHGARRTSRFSSQRKSGRPTHRS